VGVDISEKMLDYGRIKVKNAALDKIITLKTGDAENLSFSSNTFDAITVSFGVRNFENLEKGIAELYRVVRSGGRLVVLEFSKPQTPGIKQLYNFYFTHVLPRIGRLVSKDTSAYTYLPQSVQAFPQGAEFVQILTKNGFKTAKCIRLTFGICSIYIADK
jgi:demethylmenaquinone methyltransferase/2-methoxy-6-polyprenyl-1,4-benzoquinol methylase